MNKYMNFLDIARKRQSVREYLDKPVEKEKIEQCIEAARIAPSACNSQPWSFIVIDDPVLKNTVAEQTSNMMLPLNHFTKQAPVLIAIILEKAKVISQIGGTVKNKEFPLIDLGIAAEHICLQAVSEGLGTCILGWFNENKIKQLLNVPARKRIGLIITLGYPSNDKIRPKKRKELKDIIRCNSYG
jgi:nitroreductase